MPALPFKHLLSIVVSVLLIFTFFATAWHAPRVGTALGWIFLLFGLAATGCTIVRKHRAAYRQGNIPFSVSVRNICLEIAAILLAMALAGLAGRQLSAIATGGMAATPQKLIAGIGIGLLAGWAVGLLVRALAGRLVKNSPGS